MFTGLGRAAVQAHVHDLDHCPNAGSKALPAVTGGAAVKQALGCDQLLIYCTILSGESAIFCSAHSWLQIAAKE